MGGCEVPVTTGCERAENRSEREPARFGTSGRTDHRHDLALPPPGPLRHDGARTQPRCRHMVIRQASMSRWFERSRWRSDDTCWRRHDREHRPRARTPSRDSTRSCNRQPDRCLGAGQLGAARRLRRVRPRGGVVPTLAPVATTDDWAYARSAQILLDEARLTIFPVVAATAVFQIAWGALRVHLRANARHLPAVDGGDHGARGLALYGLCRDLGVARHEARSAWQRSSSIRSSSCSPSPS